MPAEPYEVEPAIMGKRHDGASVVKKAARRYMACQAHRDHFDDDKRRAAAEKEAAAKRRKDAKAAGQPVGRRR